MTRFGDVLKCARPLLFEDGPENFEYSRGGTFFFCKYHGKVFGVTAKHCLRNRQKEQIRLFISDGNGDQHYAPIKTVHIGEDPTDRVVDWADIEFMEIDTELISSFDPENSWILDFDLLMQQDVQLRSEDRLVIRGCPDCLSEIDYDLTKISTGFYATDGRYVGRSHDQNTHILRLSNSSEIADANGLSGSPVFKVLEQHGGIDYWFVGMVLRSTVASQLAHFLDCGIVYSGMLQLTLVG